MSATQQHRHHEAGMVSILVTMILMIVISLIVLGFAQISRRNQRQTLDRQLSSQAFYAAETGVNDVHNLINAALATGASIPAKPDCTNGSGAAAAFYGGSGGLNPSLDAGDNVSYTCVMVDPAPTSLAYGDIGTAGTVVPMMTASGSNFSSITLTWQSKTGSATPTNGCPTTATNKFSPTATWTCGYGVLRFDLVPAAGSSLSLATLQDSTLTSFLVPVPSSATASMGYPGAPASRNGNNLVATKCTNTQCTMTITGLNANKYYMRLLSFYKDVSLQITATEAGGAAAHIEGSQATIDATGKAQDTLRRIQVRLPLTDSSANQMADYAIQTTDSICKRFAATDGYFQSYASTVVPGLTSITAPPNPLCQ